MKQFISTVFLLTLCALTVSALSIPVDTEEHPKLQFYKDLNYTIEQILEDLAKDHKQANNSNSEDKKRTRRSTCYATQLYGGVGGTYFDDGCRNEICYIDIAVESYVIRSIQTTYRNSQGQEVTTARHGFEHHTASAHRVHFGPQERIIAVVGRAGHHNRGGIEVYRVYQLAFLTDYPNPGGLGRISGHVFGPYGPENGELFIVNKKVVSFIGRSGSELDSIGFRFVH